MVKKGNSLQNYLFHQGSFYRAFDYFGAHFSKLDGKNGVIFRTWAPNATTVGVVGDFNGWNESGYLMKRITKGGIFELFVPNLKEFCAYKYSVTSFNKTVLKADPYAFHSETPPKTASKIYDLEGYCWGDDYFLKNKSPQYDKPINVYEVNLASWKRKENGDYYSYVELAKELVAYVKDLGYTHVEFMPLAEYPFDGSWGYQVTGYYSITSRFGTPKDFMYLVDTFHQNGIGVILDWVPAHFPKDEHGLYMFDGSTCYENPIECRRSNKTWGTHVFDWGRNEVRSFLISNALFLFEKFHIDGLRVDAVASMLYLDYDKEDGEWIPNVNGGNYNLDAIAFFKQLNSAVFEKFPNALMIAEESTAFPLITHPVYNGGLGFNFKWNMGWMNDVLSYFKVDPYFRSHEHNKLTFSMCYAFSENYVLPFSHDEVVHGKKSLIDKMPGDVNCKFSNLRALYLYTYSHPGKKLSFMGSEFAQFREWNYKDGLEFFLINNYPLHKKFLKFTKRLNEIYKNFPALYEIENSWDGFKWISADERDNNVISFERKDKKGNTLVSIINFSGNYYKNYRLGLEKGEYEKIICSDDKRYGGNGQNTKKHYKTSKKFAHGKENSILISLPAFSGIYFKKIK